MTLMEMMVRYRAKHDLTQKELADECKVSVVTVNAVERGLQTPSALTEAKIRLVVEEKEEE